MSQFLSSTDSSSIALDISSLLIFKGSQRLLSIYVLTIFTPAEPYSFLRDLFFTLDFESFLAPNLVLRSIPSLFGAQFCMV
jgi:hypothetical protein